MKLAEQIKLELTERARTADASRFLLEYVMNRFRNGDRIVVIYNGCYGGTDSGKFDPTWAGDYYTKKSLEELLKVNKLWELPIKYENGRHYMKGIDVTGHPAIQNVAFSQKDFSDKKFFLESEGFHVDDYRKYGCGRVLDVTF